MAAAPVPPGVLENAARRFAQRDEWLEVYRAVHGGALTLIALSLRHGDARSAAALREAGARNFKYFRYPP